MAIPSDSSSRQLVFDIGGTLLRAAVCHGSAASLDDLRAAPAPSYVRFPNASWTDLRRQLISEMSALRAALDPAGALKAVIVAFPGPVDAARRVLAGPPLWGSLGAYPYALANDLQEAWPGTRVSVLNDVTAAGYRYMRDADDEFCIVTISTGIGNKVFVRGQPLIGPAAAGGEIGHLQVDSSKEAALCDCGGRGHLGALAGGRGTLARAKALAERAPEAFRASVLSREMGITPATLRAESLATAYVNGDSWATGVVDEGVQALGAVFASIHLAVGVDRFVLIGGFTFGLGPRFRDAMHGATNARCWTGTAGAVAIELGQPDGACALIGGGRAEHLALL